MLGSKDLAMIAGYDSVGYGPDWKTFKDWRLEFRMPIPIPNIVSKETSTDRNELPFLKGFHDDVFFRRHVLFYWKGRISGPV